MCSVAEPAGPHNATIINPRALSVTLKILHEGDRNNSGETVALENSAPLEQ